jgi:hypothetical protein
LISQRIFPTRPAEPQPIALSQQFLRLLVSDTQQCRLVKLRNFSTHHEKPLQYK